MFAELQRINERPAVFSKLTTATLWTDPHVSEQMLRFHLDPSVNAASRTAEFIDASAAWIAAAMNLGSGARVLDLGCGPGLYSSRFARTGAHVTGVDFSSRSIAYARAAAEREGLEIDYVHADYLAWQPTGAFDLVALIFCDYCPLAPEQRRTLLRTVRAALAPGGSFLFDVVSVAGLEKRIESASYQACDAGFWSAEPYFEFVNRLVYREEAVSLDRYTVVQADRTWEIYNWLQHFTPDTLAAELAEAGFEIAALHADVAGRPFDSGADEFAVVARLASTV